MSLPDLVLLCGSGTDSSAVEVIAGRFAASYPGTATVLAIDSSAPTLTDTSVGRGTFAQQLDVAARRLAEGAFIFALGVPGPSGDAQALIDLISTNQERSAILWERPGYAIPDVGAGLDRVNLLDRLVTLSVPYARLLATMYPLARVSIAGAAIPELFFGVSRRLRSRANPHAAFFGRSHPSKGFAALAQRWRDEVFPLTHLPLRAHLVDVDLKRDRSGGGVTIDYMQTPGERARAMRLADLVVFPASYDHLPQAMLETAASGGLIVATPIDGHSFVEPEVTGLVIDGELSDLTTTVRRAMRDSLDLRRIRKAAVSEAHRWHSSAAASKALVRLVST